jgi:aminopeptidase N
MQTAFNLDALRSSHPIEVPVKDALDVDQIFDHISYLKGSSVIRMLAAHLGKETFLKGVSNYLKAHAYGNATTNDLWSALSEASGQNVNELMDPWIRKIGYPVLTVGEEPGQVTLQQSRYLSTGDVKPEEDSTTWWVPLGLKNGEGVTATALTTKEDTIRNVDDKFYKINTDNTGFYRTNYPPARLAALGKQADKLSVEDKIGLIGDAGALALSGKAHTPGLLAFVEGFTNEDNYLVWSQILTSLGTVKSVFGEDEQIATALQAFTLKLITPAVKKLGWKFTEGEDYLTGQLRSLLIHSAGLNGDQDIIKEAQSQFYKYTLGDKSAIHPNLRSAVFQINVKEGGLPAYNAVKEEWKNTTSVDGKEIALAALGKIQLVTSDPLNPDTPNLLEDLLKFIFTSVSTQDMHTPAAALAANHKTRAGLWKYIKENWESIRERLSRNMVVLDRFVKLSLQKFSDLETEADIAEFFKEKDNRGYDRSLGVVSDTIKVRAGYKQRDAQVLLEWLKEHGYSN